MRMSSSIRTVETFKGFGLLVEQLPENVVLLEKEERRGFRGLRGVLRTLLAMERICLSLRIN